MTKQALIAAGGFGTRMSSNLNITNNKSLIKYAGQTMIGHLIDSLKDGGIKKFVFSTGNHNYKEIRDIVKSKNINSVVVPYQESNGYRFIPYIWQDLLDDQFLFACGHHPLSSNLVRKMIQASNKTDCVITAYDNSVYPIDKQNEILYSGTKFKPLLNSVDTKLHKIDPNHFYVRNPYVVKKSLIWLAEKEHFKYSFSYYIYMHWKLTKSLSVIKTSIPPEFDYDYEYEKTKVFLDNYLALDI